LNEDKFIEASSGGGLTSPSGLAITFDHSHTTDAEEEEEVSRRVNAAIDELQEEGIDYSTTLRVLSESCEDMACRALLSQAAQRVAILLQQIEDGRAERDEEEERSRRERLEDLAERMRCRCSKHHLHGGRECREQGADRYDDDGIYCIRACDECWLHSGYRAATDADHRHDFTDAGEYLDEA